MEPSSAVDSVVSILKERDIHAKRETIQSALDESPEGLENLEWVSKHLRPETLLSKEELTLYTKLENSGALQPILREPSLAATRPFLEEDIQSAIKALEASTAAIQKQSATLSQQCDSLRKQMRRQESLDQDRTRDIARLRKKHESGRQNTRSSANELSDQLELAFKYETEKFGVENKRILSGLSTYLKQDDATLASVENTLSKIKFDGNDASTVKRAAHLSTILANCTAEEIRYRLDRLYLEALQNGGQDGDQPIEDDAIIALEEELESLYPKSRFSPKYPRSNSSMSPSYAGSTMDTASFGQIRSRSWNGCILDILIDMTLTKESLTAQLAERESSCEVLERLGNLYHAETTLPLVSQPSSRRESLRRRSVQPGLLLTSTRTPSLLPEQPALENLLRRIGVSPESVLRPRAEDGGAPQLHEKRSQMSGTLQHMEVAAESPLFAHLAASDNASQLLSSSLHADSQYETSLQDPGQQDELARLEAELASLQKGLQALNLDVIHQRDKAQDKFLERWQ
ncbi:hypothetical protein N7468_005707 [Penicillium chermesinum]|uniref:Uncharacterized protein n=1 Tax=Penicillium chermesinum TaxID=63820 RepID=A0A9W9P024_9EURO|nr:uncharacterized protein N7468_005707 [Penicillium chermesinum]KAJ5232751.1 hypothetical protein N7468_005707 [Penicillium chermesinum]